MRRSRCRYPRHVGDTSERTLCHGVTVAVQYLPARRVAADARESDGNAALDAFDRRVRHLVDVGRQKERTASCSVVGKQVRHVYEVTFSHLYTQHLIANATSYKRASVRLLWASHGRLQAGKMVMV